MPAEISTVGAIARANRRGLLLLSFHDRTLEARWALERVMNLIAPEVDSPDGKAQAVPDGCHR